jgi:hypothetical protein
LKLTPIISIIKKEKKNKLFLTIYLAVMPNFSYERITIPEYSASTYKELTDIGGISKPHLGAFFAPQKPGFPGLAQTVMRFEHGVLRSAQNSTPDTSGVLKRLIPCARTARSRRGSKCGILLRETSNVGGRIFWFFVINIFTPNIRCFCNKAKRQYNTLYRV